MAEYDVTTIVIPMAGIGQRFVKAGYIVPKPIISVFGEPMIKWAVRSFNFLHKLPRYTIIFIVLREHLETFELEKTLLKLFDKEQIVILPIDSVTRGQAETVLAAKNYIYNSNKLFIYNCDTYSTSAIWDVVAQYDPDGILSCFVSDNPSLSYVTLDENNLVTAVREKEVISHLATTGMYYFKRGKEFVDIVETMIARNDCTNNEFYVAPCYNYLIQGGKSVRTVLADTNWVLGTPEQLQYFLKHYDQSR